ncbi:tetratricopeptide repeat protein [Hymenobacter sp. HMF4947]|uniref:Tetratricopeptide repeat protein n=1 Tax=Hymenobacter ginkgonis TaxID=2682976 RepID=A0A7K1TBE3_9BACT|nr:tetratricopeptide repeat protein [Hymenobacter ginkgonis]MVN75726.1 tetratricopeptide repeat protein [Hymenobacter ginkgonis]
MKQFPRLALAASLAAPLALASPTAHAQQTQTFASPERYYQEGLDLFDRQQYGAAQQAFAQYMQQGARRAGEQSGPAAITGRQERLADAEYYYAVSGLYLLHPDAEGLILDFARQHPTHPRAAVAYFELAKFYFDQKNYAQASTYFQKVAPANLSASQRAESDFKLAYSYFELKNYEQARILFDRNKAQPGQYRYASSYYAGYLAYRAGDYAGARKDLLVAAENDAYRGVVPAIMTQIYYREGNYDGLIGYATKALQQSPPPQSADEIQLLVGDAYYQKQDYKQAGTYFDQYAAAHKGKIEPSLQYKIGYANYKQGDYPNAIANLKNVAARRDSLGQNAAYHLGLSYLQAGQKLPALAAFDAARQSTIEKNISENATLKYAQVQYELGSLPDVIAALRDFRRKYPRSKNQPAVDQLLSDSFLSSTDYGQALTYLESVGDDRGNTLNGTYQRIAYAQAATLYNDGKYAEALPLLDKSLKYPQDDALRAAAQVLRGEIYSVGQQYPEAITAYAAAARSARQGGVSDDETQYVQLARYGLGYAYYNTKQYAKAQPQFQAYLADPAAKPADPNYYDTTLRLGDTYYVAKDYNSALAQYDKVIQANAADKDYAYYQKGVTLGLLGRRDEANQTLAALLKANPDSRYAEQAVFQQAQLDFQAGDYAPAAAGFTRLIENRPTSSLLPDAYQRRGVAYANLEQHDKAVADFQKVLADYPRSSAAQPALYSLQESLTALGRTEEFDQAVAAFKAQNPNSKATESVEFEAAKSLYLAEKYPQALSRLQAYLKQYPDNALAPDARFFLADSYLKTGGKAQSLPLLKAVVAENKSEFVNRAVGRVADLELENKNYPEAIKYYDRLRGASSNRREVATATLGLLKAYYDSGDYTKARAAAADLSTLAGATANTTNTALLYQGKADYQLGNLDQAVTELTATVAAAPSDVNGAEAQYTLAEVLFKQKKYDEAIKEGFKVNSSYSAYELWQGRAFLLLADVYAAQRDIFQARATLNSIIDNKFPVAEVVEGARQRLKALPASDDAPAPTAETPAKTTPAKAPAPAKTTPAKPTPAAPAKAPATTPAKAAPAKTPVRKPAARP